MAKRSYDDSDMNKYDLEHATAHHPNMTSEEWDRAYEAAWAAYYTPEHKMTILRRGAATGMGMSRLLAVLFAFSAAFPIERLHPLQVGAFRLKYRLNRPAELSDRADLVVLSKVLLGDRVEACPFFCQYWIELDLMRRRAVRDQKIKPYTDLALTPVTDEENDTLEMFTHNEAARHEVAHSRMVDALTHGKRAAAEARHA